MVFDVGGYPGSSLEGNMYAAKRTVAARDSDAY